MKYEDLCDDPRGTLEELLSLFNVDEEVINSESVRDFLESHTKAGNEETVSSQWTTYR